MSFSDVFISLPNHHHREGFEIALGEMNHIFSYIEDGYLIKRVYFDKFIVYPTDFDFNSVEKND